MVLEYYTSFTYLSTFSFVPLCLCRLWIQMTAVSQAVLESSSPDNDPFLFPFSITVSIPELHIIWFDFQLDELFRNLGLRPSSYCLNLRVQVEETQTRQVIDRNSMHLFCTRAFSLNQNQIQRKDDKTYKKKKNTVLDFGV